MNQVSAAIVQASRKNEQLILHSLAEHGQARIADMMGVHESTISRFKDGGISQASALVAALGLKIVPQRMECFDPEYVRALRTLANLGIKQPEPRALEWSDQA